MTAMRFGRFGREDGALVMVTASMFSLYTCSGNDYIDLLSLVMLTQVDIFFCVRLLSVLHGHSVFSSPPQRPMTSDFERFLYQILSITLFSYRYSWERASIIPFQCWVLNKGTTGTIFITYLVWRDPWLGIEPGTSGTRSQHSTTRLSRRRYFSMMTLLGLNTH